MSREFCGVALFMPKKKKRNDNRKHNILEKWNQWNPEQSYFESDKILVNKFEQFQNIFYSSVEQHYFRPFLEQLTHTLN